MSMQERAKDITLRISAMAITAAWLKAAKRIISKASAEDARAMFSDFTACAENIKPDLIEALFEDLDDFIGNLNPLDPKVSHVFISASIHHQMLKSIHITSHEIETFIERQKPRIAAQ